MTHNLYERAEKAMELAATSAPVVTLKRRPRDGQLYAALHEVAYAFPDGTALYLNGTSDQVTLIRDLTERLRELENAYQARTKEAGALHLETMNLRSEMASKVKEARAQALEEAAKECDQLVMYEGEDNIAYLCARDIRALVTQAKVDEAMGISAGLRDRQSLAADGLQQNQQAQHAADDVDDGLQLGRARDDRGDAPDDQGNDAAVQ